MMTELTISVNYPFKLWSDENFQDFRKTDLRLFTFLWLKTPLPTSWETLIY